MCYDNSIIHIGALFQSGVTEFQVACDPGVGLYAGEIVNITKQNDEAMRLVCVTPFEEQATKWTPQLRERYFDMLADCSDLSCAFLCRLSGDTQRTAYGLSADRQAV